MFSIWITISSLLINWLMITMWNLILFFYMWISWIGIKKIGSVEMCSKFYLLKEDPFLINQNQITRMSSKSWLDLSFNKNSEVLLWYNRLGHPNFTYYEKLYPSLFINKNSKPFSCELCQLYKHTYVTYLNFTYKPSHLFALIHNDV